MPPQGDVIRQWFIPGTGIDRYVISTDIQRYLGNDATVRPGTGTGEYQGVNGYWIKAYRNLTSAMIADLQSDSRRWIQEQRQTGVGQSAYPGAEALNATNVSRNSPSVDPYGNPVRGPMAGRPDDGRRAPPDQMMVDVPPGRAPPGQGYPQGGYYQQDGRGQYAQDPRGYPQTNQRPTGPPQGDPAYGRSDYNNPNPYPSPAATVSSINQDPRGRDSYGQPQGYPQPSTPYDQYGNPIPTQRRPQQGYPDQPMVDYGQPDQYGRYPVSQAYNQERGGGPQGYGGQAPPPPPPGYTRSGEYYVQMTTGYDQPSMMSTAGPGQQYPQQNQPGRGPNPGYNYPVEQPSYPTQPTRDPNPGRSGGHSDKRQRHRDR